MANFNLSDYVTVQDRITQFWKEYPVGRIITNLMSDPHDFTTCRYKAEIYTNELDTRPATTGWAFELAGKGMANQTSHEENCETSAIGRALANLGYATSGKDRASREEMGKVARASSVTRTVNRETGEILNTAVQTTNGHDAEPEEAITDDQKNFLRGLTKSLGHTVTGTDGAAHHDDLWLDEQCREFAGYKLDGLSKNDATRLIDDFKARLKDGHGTGSAHDPWEAKAVAFESAEAYSWTQVWREVKKQGITGKPELEAFIGQPLNGMEPEHVLTEFRKVLEQTR